MRRNFSVDRLWVGRVTAERKLKSRDVCDDEHRLTAAGAHPDPSTASVVGAVGAKMLRCDPLIMLEQPAETFGNGPRGARKSPRRRPWTSSFPAAGQGVRSRALDAVARRGTRRQHNTHITSTGRVAYSWHPWFGEDVEIDGGRSYDGEPTIYCRLLGNEGKRFAAIPAWMLDAAQCAEKVTSDAPQVTWRTLRELRQLLSAAAGPTKTVVQQRHFLPSQGDADETVSRTNVVPATRALRGPAEANDVGARAGGRTSGNQAAVGPDARIARESPVEKSERFGGAS